MSAFRVLVCGGRTYADRGRVANELNAIRARQRHILVIEGGAQGADALAREWAFSTGADHWGFGADWKQHGKSAGPIRNQRMLDEARPDMVLAFPGGKGTADMIRRARAAKVPVLEVIA